jgi:O-antigen ligase
MILYTVALGTEYEFVYLNKFIFPGFILFFSALYFFSDAAIYKEVVFGVVLFSFLTLLFLFLFKGISSMTSFSRLEISEEIGMGPITQGRMAGMLGLTILILFFNSKKTSYKTSFLILFITAFLWLALTGSRGPTLALIVMFLAYSYLTKSIFKFSIALVILSLVSIPVLIYYGVLELALFERLTELSSQEDIESMKRYRRYLTFFDMPLGNFIFGLGPGGWGKKIALSDYSFPHNIIIESIVEHGIMGAIFIFTIISTGFRQFYKRIGKINSNLYMNILMLWWGYYLLNTMVSGSFIQGNINFFTLTAILACIHNQKNIYAN